MRGMLGFQERYGSEAGCIEALARLRWPQGYVCARCGGRRSYQLKARARTFECERVRSSGIGDRGNDLPPHPHGRCANGSWRRGGWRATSAGSGALLLSRELGLRYETAWLMADKLRHALTERPEFSLEGLVEVDES